MNDDIGFSTKLDRLPPTEKMGDSKGRLDPHELPHRKKGKKSEEPFTVEEDQGKGERSGDPPEGQRSGKILDIVI